MRFLIALIAAASVVTSPAFAAESTSRAVYETEVDAPVHDVWRAFSTAEGLRGWMAPLVEIDLAVGGTIVSNYNEAGTLGDESTIENTILAYDPERMITLQATGFPKDFPFEEAAKGTWSVFYFTALTDTRTKIEVVGLGYRDDEASQKMRSFFADANAWALEQLKASLRPDGAADENAGD